ncbi:MULTISPECIES: ribonuclease E inhibitor RraB [Sphingomonas]|jgi:regulator of RNase E activity RraB|uniref:Ribonuclease E inhibitor RraB n=1 Tax=Sphingomonas echinoides TaxID=59803 RepID=A0ABU4PMQ7_9SPHN|nr:ribonuclease E inhibitor RraB [Sphingomonas echinoides]MDX5985406.1 ribonuclease E inhibitor RraB [Sphingomonas echinoides]
MTLPEVSPARLEEEWAADKDVLASLRENGDRPEIVRMVDVSFRGTEPALDRLEEDAEELGFEVIEREEDEEGEISLFLGREQTSDDDAIRALTLKCLQIELIYDVEYDGWGCTAEDGAE